MPIAITETREPKLAGLVEHRVEGQVELPTGFSMPLAATSDEPERTVDEWVKLVKEQWSRDEVNRVLAEHGAILLRGLPIENADDFSRFLHAFGWKAHVDLGNPVNRVVHAPNVANANEGPPSLYIAAHSEFGISTHFPSRICFWALAAPEEGGQTPINSGAWLAKRLKEEAPEFVTELLQKDVRYTIYHPPSKLSNDANGNGVLAAWGSTVEPDDDPATIKAKVEAEIQRVSPTTTWEWQPDGGLFTFQRTPAFRHHPILDVPVVFNNLASYYGGAVNRGTLEPPYLDATGFYKPPPLYGDDSPIPLKYLDLVERIIQENRTTIRWEKNDVLIIDNLATQHSRLPWQKGTRRILASLWDCGLQDLASKVETF
ncbi:hypothetical protein JCM11251_000476 [Rhodosporidiobolus azoricus]